MFHDLFIVCFKVDFNYIVLVDIYIVIVSLSFYQFVSIFRLLLAYSLIDKVFHFAIIRNHYDFSLWNPIKLGFKLN